MSRSVVLLLIAAFGLTGAGDANKGKAVFEAANCIACHSIDEHGGSLGPDLSEIGLRRTADSLRVAVLNPDAEIYDEYLTVVLETARGERAEGVALNEDDLSIQIRDAGGNPRSFRKNTLKYLRREERSLMPSYASKLKETELIDLLAYLKSLKGSGPHHRPRVRQPAPPAESTAWLNRPERDGDERPDTLLDALRIEPGWTVVDLGAGTGYFTWRLAQRTGRTGKVIAVDVQQRMLDLAAAEVRKRGLANVQLLLGDERGSSLPQGIADLVLIANAYHEFSAPEAMMLAVRGCLKPAGRLVVLEYTSDGPHLPISQLHKMSFDDLRSEIEAAGFQLDLVLDFLPLQHGLIFTKTPIPAVR